jgi:hypothetical protein
MSKAYFRYRTLRRRESLRSKEYKREAVNLKSTRHLIMASHGIETLEQFYRLMEE